MLRFCCDWFNLNIAADCGFLQSKEGHTRSQSSTHTYTHTLSHTQTEAHTQLAYSKCGLALFNLQQIVQQQHKSHTHTHMHTLHIALTHTHSYSLTHTHTQLACIFLTHNCLFSSGLAQCTHWARTVRSSQCGSHSPAPLPLSLSLSLLLSLCLSLLCLASSLAFVNWCPSVLCFNYAQLVPNNGDALAARSPALNDDAKWLGPFALPPSPPSLLLFVPPKDTTPARSQFQLLA